MPLDRQWIEARIPHSGRMCLLEEVLSWDFAQARCRTMSHRLADNPLRSHERLAAVCGIEYAAQTMAVHGALIAESSGTPAPPGFLASVRAVQLYVARLDDVREALISEARRIAGDDRTMMYEFSVAAGRRTLLSGRAAIAFEVRPLSPNQQGNS